MQFSKLVWPLLYVVATVAKTFLPSQSVDHEALFALLRGNADLLQTMAQPHIGKSEPAAK